MTALQDLLRRVDAWQRDRRVPAFLYAVVKKFGDDRGGSLAALIAYYGFLSLFPLLLVAITVLGYVLAGDPSLQHSVETSILGKFPIIGNQLRSSVNGGRPLSGHPAGIVVGLLGLVWGSLGVTQAAQYAMAEVWHIPNYRRPGLPVRLLNGVEFLGVLALSAVVTTALTSVASFGAHIPMAAAVVGPLLATAANIGLYFVGFRVLTPKEVPWRSMAWGAVVGGFGWEVLQLAGGYLVGHQLKHSSQVYGMFGLVLGLISWIYLGAQLSVYAAEVNAVAAKRLWPRSLVQPPLTEADRRTLVELAGEERRREDQVVSVGFREERA